jgi:aminoglycoside phosphotransferase
MILEVPEIVSRLLPGLFRDDPVSVACVWTTQPKYLVFGADRDRPVCVVQVGPRAETERVQAILTRLHALIPDVVAEPLACVPVAGNECVLVQSGLPGVPWFRLSNLLRSPVEWVRMGERALVTLERLHAAVREVPEWTGSTHPGKELRRQAATCRGQSVAFTPRADDYIDAAAERLDGLGEVPCHWQHGDYCLNNLLVSRSGVAVIDLDEFGLTSVPLHDRMGLALSVSDLAPGGPAPLRLRENLAACSRTGAGWLDPGEHLPGLFLHHLLWRINRCHGRPTRARTRGHLVSVVDELAASPRSLFRNPREAPKSTLVRAS